MTVRLLLPGPSGAGQWGGRGNALQLEGVRKGLSASKAAPLSEPFSRAEKGSRARGLAPREGTQRGGKL